jgi:hypothetical protein
LTKARKQNQRVIKAKPVSRYDDARLAIPVSEVLIAIGEESKRNGTDRLTLRQINSIIKATRRAHKSKRRQ